MGKQHPPHHERPLNATLVAFILVINFVVIGGIILANTPDLFRPASREGIAALSTSTMTPHPPTATAVPPTATPLPPTPMSLPTATVPPTEAPAAQGATEVDPENGQVLFNTFQPAASFACATCHYVDREDQLIGPGLLNVSQRAESRVPDMGVEEYLHTSIVDPGAFVVPNFPDGLMPRNWAEIYSEQEINDIIAYLMTLQ